MNERSCAPGPRVGGVTARTLGADAARLRDYAAVALSPAR
jgi:hypothetical protein